jgi:hypothetical protein
MAVDTFFYPPGVSTELDTYAQSQPLLVLSLITDGLGDPVADNTEVDVLPIVDVGLGCETTGFLTPCPAPPRFVSCSATGPFPGATGTRETRNGLVIVNTQLGPWQFIQQVSWEVDGVPFGPATTPVLECDVTEPPGDCDADDQECVFSPTGLGSTNDRDWIDGVPVITGTPGDGEILWEWPGADSFDARVPLEYSIHVTTGTPHAAPSPALTSTADFLTDAEYLSTGLANGVEYHARVQAFLAVGGNGISTDGTASNPRTISNIAAATPSGTPTGLTVHLSVKRAHRT